MINDGKREGAILLFFCFKLFFALQLIIVFFFLSFVDLITVLSFDFLTICVSVLKPAFSCSSSVTSVLVYVEMGINHFLIVYLHCATKAVL